MHGTKTGLFAMRAARKMSNVRKYIELKGFIKAQGIDISKLSFSRPRSWRENKSG